MGRKQCNGDTLIEKAPIKHFLLITRTAFILLFTCVFCSIVAANEAKVSSVQQQRRSITGTVVDEDGTPIIGANVIEVGTTNGTVTNMNGEFELQIQDNASIQISYIGYLDQVINTQGITQLNVVLVEDMRALDEVIVVGYGVQRKVISSGAVSQVEGDDISKISVVNAAKALQGISPGVTIIDRGGAPGSDDPQIFLRGVGTTGNATPLVLVDGIEMSLSQVSSQEIESISILKDAASASIYGSRAAHGVLLITTKRGQKGKAQVSYDGYIGMQDLAIRPKQVGPRDYLEMVNESSVNAGSSPIFSDEVIERLKFKGGNPFNFHIKCW